MAAGHQEGDTGGAEDWDFGCYDETDNVSNLSAASKINFHLHKRDWQKIGSRANESRSIQIPVHSAHSRETYWGARAEPCASEATVTLEQLPTRQLARAAGHKRPSTWHHITAQEDEQASVHKISPVPGSAICEDSSDEEYESRCTKIHAQPAKRPRQGNQSHPGHDAKFSHAPGVQTSETEVEIESGMVWPADSSPRLQKYLLARNKEQVASCEDVTGTGHAPPFHPPPHDFDVEE